MVPIGKLIKEIKKILDMIKFPHSIFALPFALTSYAIATKGKILPDKLLWIIVAMVSARSAAMSFNRYVDAEIDALNPRTMNRHIPQGLVNKSFALIFTIVCYMIFVFSAYKINKTCFHLSPIAVFVTAFYSYTKRFTWLSHFILGLALAIAPVGAWIAVKEEISLTSLLLAFAVFTWVSGFDIIYALQDIEFDRKYGLFSIPRFLGVEKSLILSRILHSLTFITLLLIKYLEPTLGWFYLLGVIAAGLILLREHSLIKPNDLSKIDIAFFNMNGYLSLTIFTFTAIDIFVGPLLSH
ncbi:MAG: UbiA-like polyprenyltransferase [Thermosulfidibacteraceae bacterium]|jgi:4-hydroxybenzoate polyprenyltransferase